MVRGHLLAESAAVAQAKKATEVSPKKPESNDKRQRLLPLSRALESPGGLPILTADSYVALADKAMAMWSGQKNLHAKKTKRS